MLDTFNERAHGADRRRRAVRRSRTSTAVELPYGRKRALEIATTLALDPEMLLLDEPTAGMGHEDIDRIAALIKRVAADRTVLMVEHNLSVVANLCHRITVLTRGRVLAEGDYATVVEQPRGARGLYGDRPCLTSRAPLLAVKDLQAWYGESHILHGVTFDVRAGEVVTLLGRNGAGKTTTLKSIMGIVGQRTGSVRFEGRELIGRASNEIARAGIAFCPEERGIFASLTVEENLHAAAGGEAGRAVARTHLRAVPEPQGAARLEPGHQALRRRAADAGDRRASCAPARGCCCSTSRPRGSRRSSSSRSARPSAPEAAGLHHPAGRAELSASPRPSPTATM